MLALTMAMNAIAIDIMLPAFPEIREATGLAPGLGRGRAARHRVLPRDGAVAGARRRARRPLRTQAGAARRARRLHAGRDRGDAGADARLDAGGPLRLGARRRRAAGRRHRHRARPLPRRPDGAGDVDGDGDVHPRARDRAVVRVVADGDRTVAARVRGVAPRPPPCSTCGRCASPRRCAPSTAGRCAWRRSSTACGSCCAPARRRSSDSPWPLSSVRSCRTWPARS